MEMKSQFFKQVAVNLMSLVAAFLIFLVRRETNAEIPDDGGQLNG